MKNKNWKQLHSKCLENWIIPDSENSKNYRIMGIIVDLREDYLDGQLKGTGVNVRNDINNFFYFLGKIPENFLGKAVDISQYLMGEDKDSYLVEQLIWPLDPIKKYKEKEFHSSTFPKEYNCITSLYTYGKLAKYQRDSFKKRIKRLARKLEEKYSLRDDWGLDSILNGVK